MTRRNGDRLTWLLTWMSDAWRPLAAFVYLIICVFDFIVMPIWYEWSNWNLHAVDNLVALSLKFDGAAQVQALTLLHAERVWVPITLGQSGLFHIAFGAILGAASWTRGQERIKMVSTDMQSASQDFATRVQSIQPPPIVASPPGAQEVNVNVQQP